MATLAENITQAISDFNSIKDAIIGRGGEVPPGTPTEDYSEIIRNLAPHSIYGVSGLAGSEPALTRTDDAVGMSFTIDSASGVVNSDFNNVFPWNEAEIVTNTEGKFIKMPRMYFRVGADNTDKLTDIAVSKYPSGGGSWYKVEPFMYACYGGRVTDDKLVSVSGVSRSNNLTRAQFRQYALNSGSGYIPLDLYHKTVMMFLWLIEFGTKNSESVMTGRISGSGTLAGNSRRNTGGTDSLSTPTGFETSYNQMRWHYIEDFIGNCFEFVDGVYARAQGSSCMVTADPDNFSDDTSGKEALCYTMPATGCISALGWDSRHPFMCTPHSIVSDNTFASYFCDRNSGSTSSTHVLCTGAASVDSGSKYGLAYTYLYENSYSSAAIGSRLVKIL